MTPLVLFDRYETAQTLLKAEQKEYLLVSHPQATVICGVSYYVALFHRLAQEYPHYPFEKGIACGVKTSLVFTALHHNISHIFFDSHHPAWERIQTLAPSIRPLTDLKNARDMTSFVI